ncbi:hypothetical protein EGT74_02125 [Chitinophaga lutea]|uniref:Uncharacterized protein n=1 Tax=Chitinophaga lutea TaxID=2488634 RepID=A0A3N4PU77_9BACT|nr:hypothetical protein [Chitinophaga lutea]RPE12373.1 hypothetical protein EGT74_02125 [Chitinophaga lutea]
MATSITNVLLAGVSGKVGGMFVVRQRNGKTVICKLPKPYEKPPTSGQLANRDRFKKANAYAKAAILDPVQKKYYQSKAKKGQSAFNVAFRDAFRGKAVEAHLHVEGRTVGVNVMEKDRRAFSPQAPGRVKALKVYLLHASGYEMEKGAAVYSAKRERWEYTFREKNVRSHLVRVELEDLFGHTGNWLFTFPQGGPAGVKTPPGGALPAGKGK